VNSEVNQENGANAYDSHDAEIAAVLNHLNSTPIKVYNYKQATLINAHTKADITELTLDVSVDCINNYPDVPCTETSLTCNAFVRSTAEEGSQVLNDVNCKSKPEIIVEEPVYDPTTSPNDDANETKSVILSSRDISISNAPPRSRLR
jgi:hypothetical protein